MKSSTLGYPDVDMIPYSGLDRKWGLNMNQTRATVKYIRTEPELVGWLCTKYSPDTLTPWIPDELKTYPDNTSGVDQPDGDMVDGDNQPIDDENDVQVATPSTTPYT